MARYKIPLLKYKQSAYPRHGLVVQLHSHNVPIQRTISLEKTWNKYIADAVGMGTVGLFVILGIYSNIRLNATVLTNDNTV